ncbi:hypothetical protein BC831DRAFT_497557 [Entophlyctis helioformis]|nr:hypothetical protein BC831DRAFT_497557 [Entophlyctis helioformis]
MVVAGTYHVTKKAHAKVLLHAAKYSTEPVFGVLLGSLGKDGRMLVQDAVPLFHSHFLLTPAFQTGMDQVEMYAKQIGLVIAGAYAANELNMNTGVEPAVAKASSQIDNHLGGGSLLLVSYIYSSGTWKELPASQLTKDDGLLGHATDLIKSRAYETLYDLDNHLEDISLNWLKNDALPI